jgi:hypothetical protein
MIEDSTGVPDEVLQLVLSSVQEAVLEEQEAGEALLFSLLPDPLRLCRQEYQI